MTRYRFYVNYVDQAGDYQTSGHLATSPADAVETQRHYLQQGERVYSVDAKPDMVEGDDGTCRLLGAPEATDLEARFKTEANIINDNLAAKRLGRIFAAAAE